MKFFPLFLCGALGMSLAQAQELSPADREALLSRLETLDNAVSQKVDARYSQAVAAYREAMASDESSFAFYMKCLEKVEYDDQKRKNGEFREWKKKEEANLSKASFRRALRHQLRWLTLTLEASSSNAVRADVTTKAMGIVGDLFGDLKSVEDQERVLNQSVISTVFAKAYDIDKVEAKDWPTSPFKVEELFDKLFLPPLRVPGKNAELRAAWMKRIQLELSIRENMVQRKRNAENEERGGKKDEKEKARIGMADSMRPPEYDLFISDEVPKLLWLMEIDLYNNGSHVEGAKHLLAHIEKYVNHPDVKDWTAEFKTLLQPEKDLGLTPANPTAGSAPQ